MLIIAIFLLSLSGCGYKAAPFYTEDAPVEDENVRFIIKENVISNENNESCE